MKKLLSFTAIVLAMAMTTTSAFAAVGRGSGDVDGAAGVTANDVEKILSGSEAANQAGNVDGEILSESERADAADAALLMRQILMPNTVTEGVAVRAYTSTPILQSPVKYGFKDVATTPAPNGLVEVTGTINSKIKDVTDELTGKAFASRASQISDSVNRIKFTSRAGEQVAIYTAKGWSRLEYALEPIYRAHPERKTALDAIKGIIVNETPVSLTEETLTTIRDKSYDVFPTDVTADEVKEAAKRSLEILGQKGGFEIESKVYTGKIDDAAIDTIVDAVYTAGLNNYVEKTVNDLQSVFGDKVTVTFTNNAGTAKTFTIEIYENASYK